MYYRSYTHAHTRTYIADILVIKKRVKKRVQNSVLTDTTLRDFASEKLGNNTEMK